MLLFTTKSEYYLKPSWGRTTLHSCVRFFPTCWRSLGNQSFPTICQLLHDLPQKTIWETCTCEIPFLEETPTHSQIHLWTIDLTDILTRHEDPQEADHIFSTTLHRKPNDCAAFLHFYSNHSLKCRESIVFLKALRYNLLMADDTLLQKEFDFLTVSLLDIQYPL